MLLDGDPLQLGGRSAMSEEETAFAFWRGATGRAFENDPTARGRDQSPAAKQTARVGARRGETLAGRGGQNKNVFINSIVRIINIFILM